MMYDRIKNNYALTFKLHMRV